MHLPQRTFCPFLTAACTLALTVFLTPLSTSAEPAPPRQSAPLSQSTQPDQTTQPPPDIDPALYLARVDKIAGNDPFAEGRWTLQIYASGTHGKNSNAVYGGHIGFGYYFIDNLSINLELAGEAYHMQDTPNAQGGDTAGGALDLIFRWHFLRGEDWSVFADIGGGVMEAADSFPAEGTTFDFRPQAGLGATYRIAPKLHLMGGVKWFHISNARIHGPERNPSYDSVMYYAGVMVSF